MAFRQSRNTQTKTILAIVGTATLVIATFLIPQQLAQAAKSYTVTGSGQLLPDMRPVRETIMDNDLVKDPNTGKILLRFAGGIGNYGPGTIEVVGKRDTVDRNNNVMPAFQRIYSANGTFTEVNVGELTYHPAHHHYHFVNAVSYSLIDPSNGNVVVSSAKQAFCLADVAVADSSVPNYPTAPVYNRCYNSQVAEFVRMGVSPGWEDVYGKDLVGQAFDVTDLMQKPAQAYVLKVTTNPDGVLVDANNGEPQSTSVQVMIGQGVEVGVGKSRPGV